jgi:putative membrane protein
MIIVNDQPRVSAVESMVGGWAMLSPEFQGLVQQLMFGYALAVIGIILIIVAVIPSKLNKEKDSSSLDILKDRYAKGEITQEKFDEMRKNLEK